MNKTKNILSFLSYISKYSNYCTKELSTILDIDVRTIQRYKNEIEEFFDIEFKQTSKGCYTIPNTAKIKQILLDPQDMVDFEHLIDLLMLSNKSLIKTLNIDKQIIKNTFSYEDIFLLKESPFEEFKNYTLIKQIKTAIKYNKYVNISYDNRLEQFFFTDTKPLKILFAEGNWYLAVLTKDEVNNGFKFLRINFIKEFKELSKTFKTDIKATMFLQNFQTLFSSYENDFFEVIVTIDKDVSRYFKQKKFLPSQNIIKEYEDGSLKLSYNINNNQEIIFLAKQWLPYMKIVSPQSLDDELRSIIDKY